MYTNTQDCTEIVRGPHCRLSFPRMFRPRANKIQENEREAERKFRRNCTFALTPQIAGTWNSSRLQTMNCKRLVCTGDFSEKTFNKIVSLPFGEVYVELCWALTATDDGRRMTTTTRSHRSRTRLFSFSPTTTPDDDEDYDEPATDLGSVRPYTRGTFMRNSYRQPVQGTIMSLFLFRVQCFS